MAHHSRYKRITADRIPMLDEKVFYRKFANLANRYIHKKIDTATYLSEFCKLSTELHGHLDTNVSKAVKAR